MPQTWRWDTCWSEHRQGKAAGHKIPLDTQRGDQAQKKMALNFNFLLPSGKPDNSLQVSALTLFYIHELLWTSTGRGIFNQSNHSRVFKTWVPNSWLQTCSQKFMQNLFPYKKECSSNLLLFLGLFFPPISSFLPIASEHYRIKKELSPRHYFSPSQKD